MRRKPSADDVAHLTHPLRVPRFQMHGCLGGMPCPPASAFAKYALGVRNDIADRD
jgi:hypothetical protein